MSIAIDRLVHYLDGTLAAERFQDHGPNGLQVAGAATITSLATACTASLANCRAAVERDCGALLVHHGLFWGRGPITVTGILKPRLACLLRTDCNLLAYHLPLDGHPQLGNNAVGLRRLGLSLDHATGFATSPGAAIGLWTDTDPLEPIDLAERCRQAFDHPVIHCPGGPDQIRRIGMISGGGQSFLTEAAAIGLDALVTGETSEQTWHEARELGCHVFACGHHATECLAVHELGAALALRFDLQHHPLPEDNPL